MRRIVDLLGSLALPFVVGAALTFPLAYRAARRFAELAQAEDIPLA